MPTYPRLAQLVLAANASDLDSVFLNAVVPHLIDVWLDDYGSVQRKSDIVETTSDGFSYLFDIVPGRLIAAWGISKGKHTGPRDSSRMARHPLGGGAHYHRGHAIPHTLGGPLDINLVPQLGSVNVGAFRRLERLAVATPGALYFTYWCYPRSDSQKPLGVEQGLLLPGRAPDITMHEN